MENVLGLLTNQGPLKIPIGREYFLFSYEKNSEAYH